jgi:rhodanese-related sulfurtransferase
MCETSVGEAAALLEEGAVLLDVREPEEWEAGHVSGAVFIPMGQLGEHLDDLPSGRRVVVMCRSGHRSAMATSALRELGIEAVNLTGGLLAWQAEGRPVVTDAGLRGTVS